MAANQYFKCNNQPKTRGSDGGEKGMKIRLGGSVAEAWFHRFGGN